MKALLTGLIWAAVGGLMADGIRLKPVDLKGKASVYDDTEPDYKKPIAIPKGKSDWAFTFGELKSFKTLKEKLGETQVDQIMTKHKFKIPQGEFGGYRGKDGLDLHYYVRPGPKAGSQLLFIVSMGEYQPARYMAHLEGIWEVSGAGL